MTGLRARVRGTVGHLHLDVELQTSDAPTVLVGPNGSGKSTLLRMIAGAIAPTSGEVVLTGRTVYSSARGIDLPSEARRIGYVPQGYGLFPHLRVIDNVAFGLSVGRRRQPRRERLRAARDMLAALESDHLAERLPRHLSGGEQQRVALARAMVTEPAMLLLDEPLAALDAGTRRRVRAFLTDHLRALGRPTLLVTHDIRDAAALGAQVLVLDQGQIIQRGTVPELRASPANDYVAELVE